MLRTVFLHLLFWVAVWFFFVYFFSYNSDDSVYIMWFASALLPVTMLITYIVVYLLVPRYLLSRKYLKFTLFTFYTLVFSSYAVVLIIYACLIFLLKFDVSGMPPMSKNFVFVLILEYLIVGIVSFISVLNHNFKTNSRNRELQNKILATQLQLKEQELLYLKKQIHPHFLFNTLNTIYGFALRQSKQTPDLILKLSNLLDYILYQINKPAVSLRDEVLHIKEYIELEKIRFEDNLKVIFNAGQIEEEAQVAPLLLIPFVENAFKHGGIVNGFMTVEVNVRTRGTSLYFLIINTLTAHQAEDESRGIGLENIRKRLDLHYKDNYELNIKTVDQKFEVQLTIPNLNQYNDA